MSQHEGTFERTAEAALTALGARPSDEAIDAWADPAGAAQLLPEEGGEPRSALLRAAWDPAPAGGGPAEPWWVYVTRGSAEIRLGPAAGASEQETRRVTRVVVESEAAPDGEGGAAARAVLLLDRKAEAPSRLLVAEAWARTEELAVARVRPVAARLARVLSVPASLP